MQGKLMRVTAAHSPGVEVSILRVELAVEVWTEAWLWGHHTICTHTEYIEQTSVRDSDPAEPLPPSSSPHLSS